jgi:hypothetical protein
MIMKFREVINRYIINDLYDVEIQMWLMPLFVSREYEIIQEKKIENFQLISSEFWSKDWKFGNHD